MAIRDFDPRRDKDAALSFINGSQAYEHIVEPDRRLDGEVAGDWYAVVMERVAKQQGRIFVAEENGTAVGWGVFVIEENMLFVVEAQRRFGYILELFVNESVRGQGVGQALIAACEEEARRLKLPHIMLGVLAKNSRAADIYARSGYSPYAIEMRKFL